MSQALEATIEAGSPATDLVVQKAPVLPAASISLAPQQEQAVKEFKSWFKNMPDKSRWEPGDDIDDLRSTRWSVSEAPYFLLEGYAGTGKSTILPFLIDAARLSPTDVLFLAPTGKASKVITKKLIGSGIYKSASTIHSAIYRPNQLKAFVLEKELEALNIELGIAIENQAGQKVGEIKRAIQQLTKDLERAYTSDSPSFQLNVDAAAVKTAKLVVVDECSMVGEAIADDLRSFGTPILAIGDPGQLQPVGDKPGFCTRKADMRLTDVHRQARDNPIIWASMLVRDGKEIPNGNHGDGQLRVLERREDNVTYDIEKDAQIIVGTNNRRWNVTRKLREICGLSADGPAKDEMMIICKNSRRYPALVNGTMVRMTEDVGMLHAGDVDYNAQFEDEDGHNYSLACVQAILEEHYLGKNKSTSAPASVFRAKQDPGYHQLDWAYAITCHKSQGSQWDEVVVHNEAGCFREEAQKWLYTAVTRAAKKLTLVQP